jgi:putative NADH-flavin reductase
MRLAVFGATGASGRQLVRQALAQGDAVIAYGRSPEKLQFAHERLTVVRGELSDQAALERVVSGADAVISLLGPLPGSRGDSLQQGMAHIIAAMEKHGVRRLVSTSTLSAQDPNDRSHLRSKLMVTMVRMFMRPAYDAIVGMADAIRRSDLDWTLVRITLLNNKPGSGSFRVGYVGRGQLGMSLSRGNLATFLLQEVSNRRYLRQAPAITD